MEVPSNLALAAIHLNTSKSLWVPSIMKLYECFKKYSFLASFTKSESLLNASVWLSLSALFQGGTSCCLELGGSYKVVLDVAPPRGMLSPGSGEGCHLLGLGDCLDTGMGRAAGADCSSAGEVLHDRVNGWDVGACPNKMWYEATSTPLSSAGLVCRAAWQAERKSFWLLPSSQMTCSSRSCMTFPYCLCSNSAWEALQVLASLMATEQAALASQMVQAWVDLASLMVARHRALVSRVTQEQMALASLMDLVVSDWFWWSSIPSSQMALCLWHLWTT